MDKQEIIELNEKALVVKIPEGHNPTDWNIHGEFLYLSPLSFRIELPAPGSWSILAKGNEMTEEQWKGIVEKDDPHPSWPHIELWFNYDETSEVEYLDTATESGLSLLKSKGLNPIEVIILIKQ